MQLERKIRKINKNPTMNDKIKNKKPDTWAKLAQHVQALKNDEALAWGCPRVWAFCFFKR